MKFVGVFFIAVAVSLVAQAGGPKRDGFLKNSGDAVLTLTSSGLVGNCYSLVSKEGKVPFTVEAPKMTVNGQAVVTMMKTIENKTSNQTYEITGKDVSGTPFKIKTKKWQEIQFCANDDQVATANGYTIVLTIGTKTGSVEVPGLK